MGTGTWTELIIDQDLRGWLDWNLAQRFPEYHGTSCPLRKG